MPTVADTSSEVGGHRRSDFCLSTQGSHAPLLQVGMTPPPMRLQFPVPDCTCFPPAHTRCKGRLFSKRSAVSARMQSCGDYPHKGRALGNCGVPDRSLSEVCAEPFITAGQGLLLRAKWLPLCRCEVHRGSESADHYSYSHLSPRDPTRREKQAEAKEPGIQKCPNTKTL